jgi:NAD(P)-dependent dehydrogenase (short-subunit alcohol dehydrogenase family)
VRDGWTVVGDARRGADLDTAAIEIDSPRFIAVAGDLTDPVHRATLLRTTLDTGPLSLLISNASRLGPSPQPLLADYPDDELRAVYDANVFAPLALIQAALPALAASGGTLLTLSSDAAVEAYEGWGGYGSSKAAADHLTLVLGAELAGVAAYAVDPGDMRTEMHQAAFPGDDISDRPDPRAVVPAFLRLLEERPPSGRYRAADFAPIGAAS